jgi:hypothetical protein
LTCHAREAGFQTLVLLVLVLVLVLLLLLLLLLLVLVLLLLVLFPCSRVFPCLSGVICWSNGGSVILTLVSPPPHTYLNDNRPRERLPHRQ